MYRLKPWVAPRRFEQVEAQSWRFEMSLKSAPVLTALAIALGGLALPATAQTRPPQQKPATTAPAPKTPVTGQILKQDENTILANDLIGRNVYEPDNKTKIGSISDLVLSKDGKSVHGFVIGVGGFLGIGEKDVALQIDRLKMSADPKAGLRLSTDVKKDELANAPAFKSAKNQIAEKEAAERARSQPQPGTPKPTQRPAH
jgi:sporulation protein YlmC with PRC-barrel domain